MPLKRVPFVGLEDALKGAIIDGTAQGQHVVGLIEMPRGSEAFQPHMTDRFLAASMPPLPMG